MTKVLKTTTLVRMWVIVAIFSFAVGVYAGLKDNFLAVFSSVSASLGFLLAAGYVKRLDK